MRNFILPIAALAILTFTGCTGSGDSSAGGPDGETYDESQLNPSEGPGSNPDPTVYTGSASAHIDQVVIENVDGEATARFTCSVEATGGPIGAGVARFSAIDPNGGAVLFTSSVEFASIASGAPQEMVFNLPFLVVGWVDEPLRDVQVAFVCVWDDGEPADNLDGGYVDTEDFAYGPLLRGELRETSNDASEPASTPPAPTANG